MRTPGTIVRGVFVCFIILGAVFLFNVNLAQSGTGYFPGTISGGEFGESPAEPAADPPGGSPILAYIPMVSNRFKILENQVIVANGQAFDKCTPPRVEDMQTWWDESPYATINIYLGGISLACSYRETDPQWFDQVARQGWSFILTWAGPQAPPGCHTPTDYKYPMSIDPALAHLEGRLEADAAVEAAAAIGFKGRLVIYYDIEGYEDEPEECRTAVASFIKGWTERLHELDVVAGAYGSPCRSYVADWAANDPPPDNVWIAHWYTNDYDPKATVWDFPVNIPCLSDDLWSNSQRIKQYNGDHYETWGNLKIRIDSNVVDGQVNALLADTSTQAAQLNTSPVLLSQTSQALKSMDLITSSEGWVLLGDRLLWTADGGSTWQEISPHLSDNARVLDAMFSDPNHGWLALREANADQNSSLSILSTVDGGLTWQAGSLPNMNSQQVMQIDSAFIDFVDNQIGWIALKLHSSSNFSFGRLFATQDGGLTWQERSLPLGEPVEFIDLSRGWTAGDPRGNQIFHTNDGGQTWRIQELPPIGSNSNRETEFGLPVFENQESGVLPMTLSDGEIEQTYLFSTTDAGQSWSLAGTIQDKVSPGVFQDAAPALMLEREELTTDDLPDGVVALDMVDNQHGWALIQKGTCTGRKARAGETLPPGMGPLRCESYSRLMKTSDGGNSWFEITPDKTE